uniref:NAC domain-containing protein n=1 Tax=Oryza meridionalis TaxID=40149 RepID=A0A0E0D3Q4_9ORYZ
MAGGLTFSPPDHELITKFLRPKIADDTIKLPFIHDVDVYSAAPRELAARHVPARGTDRGDGAGAVYYFFCPVSGTSGGARRRQRAVGGGGGASGEAGHCGCWHPEGGKKAVLDAGGRRVGHLRRLSYGVRERGSGRRLTRLGWCMTEFGVDHGGGGGEADAGGLVLCKMYRSPRAAQVEARLQAASASSSGSKRKAAADDLIHAPASSRHRHADVMPAGVDGDEVGSIHPSDSVQFLPEEQTLVQTMDGPRSDHEVIMALAMGATVDELLGPKHGEPGGSSPLIPAPPEPCSISGGGVEPCTGPGPASLGGDMAMAFPAPPAGEFSWDKELAWIRELLSGSPPRVPPCDQNQQLLHGC